MKILFITLITIFTLSIQTLAFQPNIVLIVIDSLRADHTSFLGYPEPVCPNINHLAKNSFIFTNAVSVTSWTLPSMASLATSVYPLINSVCYTDSRLPDSAKTLAETLKEHGYNTAAFVCGPFMNEYFNLQQGFDLYKDLTQYPTSISKDHRPTEKEFQVTLSQITSPLITDRTLEWLNSSPSQPFFLQLHYWDVHYDYTPPKIYEKLFDLDYQGDIDGKDFDHNEKINDKLPARDRQHLLALYDGEIRYTDHYIGILLKELKRLHLDANTLIILTSDHGTEFLDHGQRGHRKTLFDEVLRIPLIVHLPKAIQNTKIINQQVCTIDIPTTILSFANIKIPEFMLGKDILQPDYVSKLYFSEYYKSAVKPSSFKSPKEDIPLMKFEPIPPNPIETLIKKANNIRALRTNDAKIIWYYQEKWMEPLFFNLNRNPEEKIGLPLTTEEKAMKNQLLSSLQNALKTYQELAKDYLGPEPQETGKIPDEVKERLEALGYIDSKN